MCQTIAQAQKFKCYYFFCILDSDVLANAHIRSV